MLPVPASALQKTCSETIAPATKKSLHDLPGELVDSVASCLTPVELADYAKVNRYAHRTAQCTLKNKPYLESLPAYLGSIGIRNKLTLQALLQREISVPELFNDIKELRQQIVRALQSPGFSALARKALSIPAISALILDSYLELDDVMTLSTFQIHLLQSEAVRAYLFADLITVNDALELTPKELFILEQPPVKKYLLSGLLNFEYVENLNFRSVARLTCPVVQKYIDGGFLKVMQAVALTDTQVDNLKAGLCNDVLRPA